jgi:hypothetical protein
LFPPFVRQRRFALERANASLVLFLGLALFGSGCTKLGPDFSTPPVPEPESWIESDNPKLKSEPADIDTWWTVFDDPVLNRLIEIATGENLSLQVAGIRILEARARLGIAVGDQYPQVQEASGDVSHNTISENAPNTAGLNRSFQSGSVGFDASWEMDFWGRFQRGIESADASLGATIADYDDFLVSLTADVASTYALIRELEERVELARQNVDLQQRTLKITDVRFRGGAVSELDVAQAQSLLSSTQALVPDLLRQLRQAENALAVLLGKTPREVRALLGEPGSIPSAPAEVAVGIPCWASRAASRARRPRSPSASRPNCCADARTSAGPSLPPRPRARASASPRPISIRASRWVALLAWRPAITAAPRPTTPTSAICLVRTASPPSSAPRSACRSSTTAG